MADTELDVLLIRSLADLDAAARYLADDLQPRIGAAIDDIFKAFMRQNQWDGMSDWHEDETWLAAPDWQAPADSARGEFRSKVFLESVDSQGGAEDQFWLTYLLGEGVQSIGLRWYRTDVRSKRLWRKTLAGQGELITALRKKGFEYEEAEGTFLLPIKVDGPQLALALGDESPENGLEALTKALKKLIDAKPELDKLSLILSEK